MQVEVEGEEGEEEDEGMLLIEVVMVRMGWMMVEAQGRWT